MTPEEETPEAIEAAREKTYETEGAFSNSLWADPMILGKAAVFFLYLRKTY